MVYDSKKFTFNIRYIEDGIVLLLSPFLSILLRTFAPINHGTRLKPIKNLTVFTFFLLGKGTADNVQVH